MPITRAAANQQKEEILKAPSVRKFWVIDDFILGSKIGNGRFGCVYSAKEKETERVVALKSLDYQSMVSQNIVHQVKREIQIQHHLKHKNIISLYSYFTTKTHVFIILEHASNGSLFQLLQKYKTLSPHRSAYIADCIADALAYCHGFNVIHRDIKPENILLMPDCVPKLADFGCTVLSDVNLQRTTLCGTTDYLAPEMALTAVNKIPTTHTYKVDNWGVGILLCELLIGKSPFTSKAPIDIVKNIIECRFAPEFKDKLGAAYEAVELLVRAEPEARMELDEWRQTPWIRQQVTKFEERMASK